MSRIPLPLRFALFFGILGFILSLVAGLMVGVTFGTVLIRALIFFAVVGASGYGFHFLLDSQVPELLAALDGRTVSDEELSGGDPIDAEDNEFASGGETFSMGESSYGPDSGGEAAPRPEDGHYGDHIIVEGVKIENEPKLMAEAIRTLMSRDEES